MKDQLAHLPWYLQPWSYSLPNPPTGTPAPLGDLWPQSAPPAALGSSGGLLGNLGQPAGGILGNLARPGGYAPRMPEPAINGPMAWAAATMPSVFFPAPVQNSWASDKLNPPGNTGAVATPYAQTPPIRPTVPLSGADNGLPSSPEPPPPEPPKDFRTWLLDALSDQNVRYYAGPHLYEALRKLHALTQLLPGSGTVQSPQDVSRASEEAQAGNYGNAAAHLGIGATNAVLDWLPPAKLAILGGMMARTFPWERLPTALEMEAAGKSAEKIWWEPSLERDPARNWTFEISDKGFSVHPNPDRRGISDAPLYEHYFHPGMQEAYPGFSNWRSRLIIDPREQPWGRTSFGEKLVEVRAPNLQWARHVGIHELKHLIDELEKRPPGGSPQQFMDLGISEREAYDLYWRLVGEVAARNVQNRLYMSDAMRRLRPPQATESVPRNKQINLFDDDWQ